MYRSTSHPRVPALAMVAMAATLAGACTPPEQTGFSDTTVFEGARVIVGDGSVIEDAVFVVENGQFAMIGATGTVQPPAGLDPVDLRGKTVMPAIVNAHVHLANDREERARQLRHMAYYGTGLAISLGHDDGELGYVMRNEILPAAARSMTAGRGITAPEPGRSEVPYWVTSEEEARAAVRELAERGPDFVKIWVDDRGGQYEKLSQPLYSAIIDEANQLGLKVTAHVYTLEDAKGLLRAGVDAFAHGIRDRDVDDELVRLWKERPDVVLVPNLPNPGVPVDLSWLSATVPTDRLSEMQEASSADPETQERFGIQARNLVRLHGEGVTIAFGTDGSAPWAVHLEMEDMVRAGLEPGDVIVAATSASANLLDATDLGSVAPGKSADFVVLDANPLDDITNTRRIDAVYLRGERLDREAVAADLRGESSP